MTTAERSVIDIHCNDDAEIQCGDGVHGLVAAQEALEHRGLGIEAIGFAIAGGGSQQTAHKHNADEDQQTGRSEPAQEMGEFFRGQADIKRHSEEENGIDQLDHGFGSVAGEEGSHGHFKGSAGSTGDSQTGADGEVDEQSKHLRKDRMDSPGKFIKAAGMSDSDNTKDGESDGSDGKSQHSQRGFGTSHGAEIGREDQIAGSKEHGKKGKAYQHPVTGGQSVHKKPPI